MKYFEKDAELKPLRDELAALEAQAGLTQQMERAREGNFMPLGIDGEKVSPDEYFADEYDGTRRRVRAVYFGVSDIEFRKRLIKTDRAINKKFEQHTEAELREAQSEVATAKAATHQQPWTWAAVLAVGSVAIGYQMYSMAGAIAGAVGGFFLAQGVLKNKEREAAAVLEQAENDLAELKRSQYVSSLSPELFSHMEQLTGEEDKDFSNESAWLKVTEFERKQKAKSLGEAKA
jgi:hypothetical protein